MPTGTVTVFVEPVEEAPPAHVLAKYQAAQDAVNYNDFKRVMLFVTVDVDGESYRAEIPALVICEPQETLRFHAPELDRAGFGDTQPQTISHEGWRLVPNMAKFLMKTRAFARLHGAERALYEHLVSRGECINKWFKQYT